MLMSAAVISRASATPPIKNNRKTEAVRGHRLMALPSAKLAADIQIDCANISSKTQIGRDRDAPGVADATHVRRSAESGGEVGDEIGGLLDADREPHQAVADAQFGPPLRRHRAMGHQGRVLDEA